MFSGFVHANATCYIAVIAAFLYQSVLMYIKSDLLIRMCEKKATIKIKLLLALFCGTFVFVFIELVKMRLIDLELSEQFIPIFVSLPGIVVTLIYAFFCLWSLKLTPLRTLEVTVYAYLYFQTLTGVNRIISALFFVQKAAVIDYSMNILMYAVNFSISLAILLAMSYILKKKPHLLIIKSGSDTTPNTSIAFSIFQLVYIYFCTAIIVFLIPNAIVGSAISLLLLAVFTALSIFLSKNRYAKAELLDKETFIQSLFESVNQFSAIKHDFYNILQTYNGYFELGDLEACKRYHETLVEITVQAGDLLDLSRRAVENPALISLFLNKNDYSEKMHVKLSIIIKCPLNELQMEDIDLCRIISCTLDNAIEAASDSEEKNVSLIIERKTESSNLITVTNSIDAPVNTTRMLVSGATSKSGHQGMGLYNVQKIIRKYPHSTFEIHSTEREVTARVSINSYPVS